MKKIKEVILFSLLFFFVLGFNTDETFARDLKEQYFVTFTSSIDENVIKNNGGEILRVFESSPSVLIQATKEEINNIKNNRDVILEIESDAEVVASDVNFDFTNVDIDPANQLVPWNVDYIKTLPVHNLGLSGKDIKVGIIDSGLANHKDLKIAGGINIKEDNMDFNDDYGHGTKVAGVIGALDNSYGLIGVAPNTDLYAIKVLDSRGKGSISDVVAGIEYAIENNLDIVNLSLQTTVDNSVLKSTLEKAYENNILIVAAAGNKGGTLGANTITYPAAYDEVISVGAVNQNGERYKLSSIGKRMDLTAPGEYVYTTVLDDMYFLYHGTSMAAPHVTGVAALLLERNPNLKIKDIKHILLNSTTPLGESDIFGKGLLNAEGALKLLENEMNKENTLNISF